MEQLWAKEWVPNPSYVDLFASLRVTPVFRESILELAVSNHQKKDALAVQYRECGNKFCDAKDYKAAIEQYNKSLCYAENGSVAFSLAYANRAYCFMELKLYDECLLDIDLAIKAKYPEKSMLKLEKRREICLKLMDASVKRTPIKPQLSFEPSDKIQCMANVLAIEKNDEFGRHFKAKCNIPEDRIILIEEPLMKLVNRTSIYKRCHSCLKQYTNLIPCVTCTKALFCSGECSSGARFHKYECNMKHRKFFDGSLGGNAENCVKFVLRAVLNGLETFASSAELMDFVEFLRADDDVNQVVLADGSFESMLGVLLAHHHTYNHIAAQAKILIISCIAYDYIMSHPELKMNFSTAKTQRFLMHLVTQFASAYSGNNILLQDWSDNWSDIMEHDSMGTFGAGLFNVSSYINHACMPNVIRLTTSDHMILKTIRPISKGEQIFVRYAVDPNWPASQRQRQLLQLCGFKCECQLCVTNGPSLTEASIVSTEFANLSVELAPLIFLKVKEAQKWATLKDKLFLFVKKYDSTAVPASKSIILAYEYIRMILTRECSYPTNV